MDIKKAGKKVVNSVLPMFVAALTAQQLKAQQVKVAEPKLVDAAVAKVKDVTGENSVLPGHVKEAIVNKSHYDLRKEMMKSNDGAGADSVIYKRVESDGQEKYVKETAWNLGGVSQLNLVAAAHEMPAKLENENVGHRETVVISLKDEDGIGIKNVTKHDEFSDLKGNYAGTITSFEPNPERNGLALAETRITLENSKFELLCQDLTGARSYNRQGQVLTLTDKNSSDKENKIYSLEDLDPQNNPMVIEKFEMALERLKENKFFAKPAEACTQLLNKIKLAK